MYDVSVIGHYEPSIKEKRNMNIGSVIKELRQIKKMSQEDLAEYLVVSTQAVSRWETSVSYSDITLLPLISNVFNVMVSNF